MEINNINFGHDIEWVNKPHLSQVHFGSRGKPPELYDFHIRNVWGKFDET